MQPVGPPIYTKKSAFSFEKCIYGSTRRPSKADGARAEWALGANRPKTGELPALFSRRRAAKLSESLRMAFAAPFASSRRRRRAPTHEKKPFLASVTGFGLIEAPLGSPSPRESRQGPLFAFMAQIVAPRAIAALCGQRQQAKPPKSQNMGRFGAPEPTQKKGSREKHRRHPLGRLPLDFFFAASER